VDESGHLTLVDAGDGGIMSKEEEEEEEEEGLFKATQ
jgi:hypothetical protein